MDSRFAQSASCRTRARWRRLPGTPPPAATVYPATEDRRSTERHLCANAIVQQTRQENSRPIWRFIDVVSDLSDDVSHFLEGV